ncbi:MAG: DUF2948 family protein [Paracoccaceae bacterium]
MDDARFEDGAERPLHLKAQAPDDVPVISALIQDAVLTGADMRWDRKRRRLTLLINRFRWEDRTAAEARGRPYERARALLLIDGALAVRSQGIAPGDTDSVLSILTLEWQPADDGAGRLELTLAGDGAVAVEAECLDVTLKDVTRPYLAPSGHAPGHPD